jgi:hypothetical protein
MVKLGMRTTVLPGMNIAELVLVLVAVEQESSLVR